MSGIKAQTQCLFCLLTPFCYESSMVEDGSCRAIFVNRLHSENRTDVHALRGEEGLTQ